MKIRKLDDSNRPMLSKFYRRVLYDDVETDRLLFVGME